MNRLKLCDDFLKSVGSIAEEKDINEDNIYHMLINLGVPLEYQRIETSQLFPYWILQFKDIENIDVFVDENRKYFCQFVNCPNRTFGNVDPVKMYIPLKPEYLYQGANELFTFMARENIIHQSKIGSHIRFDDIVIRVYSISDAEKIQNFIDNNKTIQDGLLQSSPFAVSRNGIAYAMDDKMSFNFYLSKFIYSYIEQKKKSNLLSSVSVDDFKEYLNDFYVNTFIEGNNHDFLNSLSSDKAVNIEQILELLLVSLDENCTYQDFMNHFFSCNDVNYKNGLINDISFIKENGERSSIENFEMLLEEYVMQMFCYSDCSLEDTCNQLMGYISDNNGLSITRKNNMRENVVNNLSPVLIKKIVSLRSGGSLAKYIRYVLNKYDKQIKVFSDVTHVMNSKYNCESVVGSLMYANLGCFSYVTRDGNCRRKMIDNFSKNNDVSHVIRMYLISRGYNNIDEIDNIYQEYVDSILNPNEEKEMKT